jgi:DNA-directed RNA polymerase subunit RPC12/RpoP
MATEGCSHQRICVDRTNELRKWQFEACCTECGHRLIVTNVPEDQKDTVELLPGQDLWEVDKHDQIWVKHRTG